VIDGGAKVALARELLTRQLGRARADTLHEEHLRYDIHRSYCVSYHHGARLLPRLSATQCVLDILLTISHSQPASGVATIRPEYTRATLTSRRRTRKVVGLNCLWHGLPTNIFAFYLQFRRVRQHEEVCRPLVLCRNERSSAGTRTYQITEVESLLHHVFHVR